MSHPGFLSPPPGLALLLEVRRPPEVEVAISILIYRQSSLTRPDAL